MVSGWLKYWRVFEDCFPSDVFFKKFLQLVKGDFGGIIVEVYMVGVRNHIKFLCVSGCLKDCFT